MKNITILVYDNCWAMSVFSVADFFKIVTILETHLDEEKSYKITFVSADGNPINTACGFPISPNESLAESATPDLVVIPPMEGNQINFNCLNFSVITPWLKKCTVNDTPILSLTTGAFILAASGLFNEKTLCTHWAFIPRLKKKYPLNKFITHESYTFDGDIYSTASLNGTFDALLAFITQDKGDKFAQICAAHLLVTHSSKVTPILFKYRKHTDNAILKVQDWLESNYKFNLNIELLAKKFGFSGRNLKRRFVLATTLPPNKYLQEVRVDKAKKLLISTTMSVKEVSCNVGYENDSFFNKVFKSNTGMTLAKWRENTKDI